MPGERRADFYQYEMHDFTEEKIKVFLFTLIWVSSYQGMPLKWSAAGREFAPVAHVGCSRAVLMSDGDDGRELL